MPKPWHYSALEILVVCPHDHVVGGSSRCPASRESIVPYIVNLGKDQTLKFEVQFLLSTYRFHTIVTSKIVKSNHHKSGTVCKCIVGLKNPRKCDPLILRAWLMYAKQKDLGM